MYSYQKRKRFIQLRGQGLSYRKIAAELNISTPTLVKWSRTLAVQINNARVIEFETLKEEYLATRKHRVKVLATQLNNISQALVEHDFSKVPPQSLLEMQTKVASELNDISPKMQFNRDMPRGCEEHIQMELTKRHAWEV